MAIRRSKTRREMNDILRGTAPGRLVILDIRDTLAHLNNQPWEGQHTLSEWVDTCNNIGCDTNIIIGEEQYLPPEHPLGRKKEIVSEEPSRLKFRTTVPTPVKDLFIEEIIDKEGKPTRGKMAIESEDDYEAGISLLKGIRNCRDAIVDNFKSFRSEIGEKGLLTIFICTPIEMFFLILHEQMVYHLIDFPQTYKIAMDEVERTSHFIIDCAADAGADMIMLGGPGTEIFNPKMIRENIIRPSVDLVRHCRERGILSLYHCCGKTKILLDNNWMDEICPDVFESFSPIPLGDIDDVAEAAHHLPDQTFFKGGLSLDRLLQGTPEEIAGMTKRAYEIFGDRKFIIAGTCMILTGTPRENLEAVTKTALEFE
jgi:uroporphyrinogen-III decarboxylase